MLWLNQALLSERLFEIRLWWLALYLSNWNNQVRQCINWAKIGVITVIMYTSLKSRDQVSLHIRWINNLIGVRNDVICMARYIILDGNAGSAARLEYCVHCCRGPQAGPRHPEYVHRLCLGTNYGYEAVTCTSTKKKVDGIKVAEVDHSESVHCVPWW